jgi:uncharacterized coiled-coil DUF342 family protein
MSDLPDQVRELTKQVDRLQLDHYGALRQVDELRKANGELSREVHYVRTKVDRLERKGRG